MKQHIAGLLDRRFLYNVFILFLFFFLFLESRSSAFMRWPWGLFKEDVRDNVAVPLPCTKAVVWCFCHQKMRWVDVLPTLIISGMDSRLQNTTWQKCCKSRWHDAAGYPRALNNVWVDFAVWDTAKKNLHIWQLSFQSSASWMTWELSLCHESFQLFFLIIALLANIHTDDLGSHHSCVH